MSGNTLPEDLDLSGRWRAAVSTEELRRAWTLDDFDDSEFTDIDVPGHWRTHPDFVENDEPLLYRRRFQSLALDEGNRAWLILDGLFYQGDVWLDGRYLGDTEGYFAPHRFEVTNELQAHHDHQLGIEVTCTPPSDRNAKRSLTGVFQDGPFLNPNGNPGGIWRGVHVRRTGPVAITHQRVLCTEATRDRALVFFAVTLDATVPTTVTLYTTIGDRTHVQVRTLATGENQVNWTVPVDHPDLWWPHALGDQPLHDVRVAVHVGDVRVESLKDATVEVGNPTSSTAPTIDAKSVPSDETSATIGLRRVTMRDWIISVNGERLFAKGVNLAPAAAALGEVEPSVFADQIQTARAAGLDLVRVSGHISRPELYDAADRAGMLVWQDLPLQWGYHRSVRKQAARQARAAVELLGHHPSIAVWCGHNEPDIDMAAVREGHSRGIGRLLAEHSLPNWNRTVLDRTIKRALTSSDPSRPIVASSGVWPHPPSLDGTDVHLSLGWRHGEIDDMASLARGIPRVVRFVGELGSPSVPDSADFVGERHWPNLDWERLATEHGYERDTFDERLPPEVFATFDEWRTAGQQYQAMLVRSQVETLRRLKYRPTGGFAVFFLSDARPAISASLIDHAGNAKPALGALTAACAPILPTLSPWPSHLHPGDMHRLDVHIISDVHSSLPDVVLDVRAWWDGGERTWRFGGDLAADECTYIGRLDLEVPEVDGPMAVDLTLSGPQVAVENRYTGHVHRH